MNLKMSLSPKVATLLSLALALCQIPTSSGYSGGASDSVCDTMIPGHGAAPKNTSNPFKIALSSTSVQGRETVEVTLASRNGNDEFKGLFIQMRKPGEANQAFGEFGADLETGHTKPMHCFNGQDNALTHTSGELKKSVKANWTAPNEDATYDVYYTVVGKTFDQYWTAHVHNEKVRVTRNAAAVAATVAPQQASPELVEELRKFYGGCGKNKGCFGMPGSCVQDFDSNSDNPTACDIMVTWEKSGELNVFEITGTPGRATATSGYVAVGLSEDGKMSDDSVVGCTLLGAPAVERYHNPASYGPNQKHSDPKYALEKTEAKVIDGNLFCKFQQKDHKLDGVDINFQNKYYLLLSRADSIHAGGLGKHSATSKAPSPKAIHITDTEILGASANTWLVQLHGGLMVIAWLLCASTGMFTARYYKLTHTDFMPFNKAFWFALHVFCMFATAFLTIAGAIFIIIKKKGFELRDWHPILGVIVVGLAIFQVIIAFFRPHPGTSKRPIFNWVHWGVGNSAHIIGIVCIFLAWDLGLADLQRFEEKYLWMWIMLALVLFHVLMHIVMSIHTLWADKQMDSSNKKRAVQPGPMKSNGLSTEAPGTAFRTFMLALYLLVMAAGAIALTALIFWPKEEEEAPTS